MTALLRPQSPRHARECARRHPATRRSITVASSRDAASVASLKISDHHSTMREPAVETSAIPNCELRLDRGIIFSLLQPRIFVIPSLIRGHRPITPDGGTPSCRVFHHVIVLVSP